MAPWFKRILLLILFLAVPLQRSAIPPLFDHRLDAIVSPHHFGFTSWEIQAITSNLGQRLGIGEASAHQGPEALFEKYQSSAAQINHLSSELRRATSVAGSEGTRVRGLEQELRAIRQERAPIVAALQRAVERQVERALAAEGFALTLPGGSQVVFPPVWFQLDRLPHILVVSSRDYIETKAQVFLKADLTIDEMERIEAQVDSEGVSSLVMPLGGLSTYPSMIGETSSADFVISTAAHEWFHNYLTLRPLGWNYGANSKLVIMNETVADIAGGEIAQRVREMNATAEALEKEEAPPPQKESSPPQFDFNAEMRQIRLRADELLAEGKVEEAEAFMEERRQFLATKGYHLRKLNQAYFAFHGSYADSPVAVDPVVGQLKELRGQSGSLKQFIDTIAGISSHTELQQILEERGIVTE